LERALREGANALKLTFCVTKDKEVILWHDWNPNELLALIRESGLEPEVKYKPNFLLHSAVSGIKRASYFEGV